MLTFAPSSTAASNVRPRRGQAAAEEYYSLVHWLRAMGDMSGITPKSIGITSCARGAGVSTVAANLAIVAADIDERPVLLLDLNSNRAVAAGPFQINGDLGLRDALVDPSRATCYAKQTPAANLSLLGANSEAEARTTSLDFNRISDLMHALENEFSFVVVDLPAVESSQCFITAGLLSGVLLVIEAERTRLETAARAKQRLIDARANVLGVILNKHRQHMPSWLEARL